MSEPRCTHCDSLDVVPIVWGLPSPELMEAMARGEVDVVIGGCLIVEPSSTHECRQCRSRFAKGETWHQPPADRDD